MLQPGGEETSSWALVELWISVDLLLTVSFPGDFWGRFIFTWGRFIFTWGWGGSEWLQPPGLIGGEGLLDED